MSLSHAPFIRPEFMPLSIARAIWKGKYLALGVTSVVCLLTYAIVKRIPGMYQAEALVLVDSQKIPRDFVPSTVRVSVEERLGTISRQILSAERLKKLIEEVNLYPLSGNGVPDSLVDEMRRHIHITLDRGYSGGLTAFRVGFTGSNPRVVADVANRLAAFFVEENLKEREIQAEGTAEFIEVQLKEAKKKLDELETRVTQYKMRHSGELPQQQNALLGALGRLQAELQANSNAIERARQNKVVLESSLDLAEATLASLTRNWENARRAAEQAAQSAPEAGRQAPVVIAAPQPETNPEIAKLEAQLAELRLRYSEEHPDVRRTRSRLEKLLEMEAAKPVVAKLEPTPAPARNAEPAKPRPVVLREPAELAQARDRVQTLKAQIAAVAAELRTREADEQRLRREMSNVQARIDRLPVREQEMGELLRDYEISKANYQGLLSKKLSADMATDLERRQKAERFTIVDPARPPAAPFKPNRRMMYLMGCGLGLMLGFAAAFGNELRKNLLLGEWELPAEVVVLGSLPRIEVDFAGASMRTSRLRWAWWSVALLVAITGYVITQQV